MNGVRFKSMKSSLSFTFIGLLLLFLSIILPYTAFAIDKDKIYEDSFYSIEPTMSFSGVVANRSFSGIPSSSSSSVIGVKGDIGGDLLNALAGAYNYSFARNGTTPSDAGIYNSTEGILELFFGGQLNVVCLSQFRVNVNGGISYISALQPSTDTHIDSTAPFIGSGIEYNFGKLGVGIDYRKLIGGSGTLFGKSVSMEYSQVGVTIGYALW